MAYTFHPPTRDYCSICEKLSLIENEPIISTYNGKASSASKYPFHNWYYFVLGYSPEFPEFILKRKNIIPGQFVVDPFMGTGTTLVTCKSHGIDSAGVDANDYFVDIARAKLDWNVRIEKLTDDFTLLKKKILGIYQDFGFLGIEGINEQPSLFDRSVARDFKEYDARNRPTMLDKRYISEVPFVKWNIIKTQINELINDPDELNFFRLAISSIIVPASNIKYGPGFGVVKPRDDIDVYNLFVGKVNQMLLDLMSISDQQRSSKSVVIKGDSRTLSEYFQEKSVDLMVTSPPYPGDHEYTKYTRLELIAMDYARNNEDFRVIKKRMLRGSTTNIYKEDDERQYVEDIDEIRSVTDLINERLKKDGATSGFEKLYSKLVWEYFGGMYRVLKEAKNIIKDDGCFALLVSDSHAFKMVHIQTAKILGVIGKKVGYTNTEIILWQKKISTSHKYSFHENVLILKP